MRFARSVPVSDGSGVISAVGRADATPGALGGAVGAPLVAGENVGDGVAGVTLVHARSSRQSRSALGLIGLAMTGARRG
jgi:hypothetical protein